MFAFLIEMTYYILLMGLVSLIEIILIWNTGYIISELL